ncbi:uncharacterized protein LOC135494144 [Lineus longissimus]|uniref:uncharacterized protein LOC135494144 n=1 Tax=Lineus longissimus TaxID=88925 RepID=UPI00315DA703
MRSSGRNHKRKEGKMKGLGFRSKAAAYVAGGSAMLEILPCISILLDRLLRVQGEGTEITQEFRIVIYVSFGMYSFLAVTSLAFLVGVKKDKNWLFIPLMLVLVALIAFEAVVIMIHKRQRTNEVLRNWEVAFMISFVVRLVVNIVALLIAMFHYKEVRVNSENTSRRRRARVIQSRQRNLTTVTDGRILDPGFILKPPPYLEKPPSYCSNSPPPTYSSEPTINVVSDMFQNTIISQNGAVAHPTAAPVIPPPDYSLCGDDYYSDFSDHPGAVPPPDYSVSGDESSFRNLH